MSGVKVGALAIAEGDFLRLEIISQGGGDGHRGLLRLDFLEEGCRPSGFFRGGQAGEKDLIKAADLGGFVARDFLDHSGGEGFTAFQHEGAVEEKERLIGVVVTSREEALLNHCGASKTSASGSRLLRMMRVKMLRTGSP